MLRMTCRKEAVICPAMEGGEEDGEEEARGVGLGRYSNVVCFPLGIPCFDILKERILECEERGNNRQSRLTLDRPSVLGKPRPKP